MGGVYYDDVNVKCPFYIRGRSGFIQCEGFEECSTVKILFCSSVDGHPLRDRQKSFSDRYCDTDYKSCPIYKLAAQKYEDGSK